MLLVNTPRSRHILCQFLTMVDFSRRFNTEKDSIELHINITLNVSMLAQHFPRLLQSLSDNIVIVHHSLKRLEAYHQRTKAKVYMDWDRTRKCFYNWPRWARSMQIIGITRVLHSQQIAFSPHWCSLYFFPTIRLSLQSGCYVWQQSRYIGQDHYKVCKPLNRSYNQNFAQINYRNGFSCFIKYHSNAFIPKRYQF